MSSLRDILKGVPQSPLHHPEGDVWAHTHMVRKSLDSAIQMYNSSPLSQVLGPVVEEDRYLLRVAAWLHDVGKSSATAWTHPDDTKTPWTDFQKRGYSTQQMMNPEFGDPEGKWQAVGHEDPAHYEPAIQGLGSQWQAILQSLPSEDQGILWSLVQQHMQFGNQGPHNSLIKQMFDAKGNVLVDRKTKLLLVLKLMDNMGRGIDNGRIATILQTVLSAVNDKRAQIERRAAQRGPADRESFEQFLRQKRDKDGQPFSDNYIAQMLRNRYGQ